MVCGWCFAVGAGFLCLDPRTAPPTRRSTKSRRRNTAWRPGSQTGANIGNPLGCRSGGALLFGSDAIIWHVLPSGFERTLYDGALAFWLLPLSLLALAFA